MKITNRLGLPQAIVDAVTNDSYTKGGADFSATGLLRSPYMARLERDHWGDIEEDVIDRIWALDGQVLHSILERGGTAGQISEIRLFGGISPKSPNLINQGVRWSVSGQLDVYIPSEGLIQDYKRTSVWSVIMSDGGKSDWESQLNILAHLARMNGGPAKRLQIVAFFRDWSATKAKNTNGYPTEKVQILDIPLWTPDRAQAFVVERCEAHHEAKNAETINEIQPCTDEETWAKPSKWAVMKPGRKSAVKLHDSEESAKRHISDLRGHYIEHRPGVRTRCESYCRVAQWCPDYQKTREADNA